MFSHEENLFHSEYHTGSPSPARRAGGAFSTGVLVAAALAGIIVATAALGLRLFATQSPAVLASLSGEGDRNLSQEGAHMNGTVLSCESVGIVCQSISNFCAEYYNLPQGVYIINVEKNSVAFQQGVLPGDVLVKINGMPTFYTDVVQYYVDTCPSWQPLRLLFSRNGQEFYVYYTPEVQ